MRAGKHVVTANKQLVCAHYDELLELARECGVSLRCTAAAGGGIPWLTSLSRAARLDEITLTRAPACRLCWIQSSLKIRSSLDMEPPIRRLEETQKDAVVFLGKVGLGITPENLYAGAYDQYDGIFLVLDEEDEFTGPVTDLPETDCLCVRFRGSHPEAPAQYRCLMACARQRGLTVTGFSREITLIDYGITDDTEKFVTEISLPVAPQA